MTGAGLGVGVVVIVVGLLATFVVGQTIRGIAKTALYLYVREGSVPEGFTDFDFETLGGRTDREASRTQQPAGRGTVLGWRLGPG